MIVGAGGGIGAALLEEMLADPSITHIFATHRRAVDSCHPKVTWWRLDFDVEADVADYVHKLAREAQLERIDLLVVATGFLAGGQVQPEKNYRQLHAQTLQDVYRVNAVAPLLVFAGLEKPLKKAAAPKVMFLSAQVGSIEDNHLGGWYGYRMAKAALNMGVKNLAIEAGRWRNQATLVAVHPGTTTTALSKPFTRRRKQPVSPASETGARLYSLLQSLQAEDHHGRFLTSHGEALPW